MGYAYEKPTWRLSERSWNVFLRRFEKLRAKWGLDNSVERKGIASIRASFTGTEPMHFSQYALNLFSAGLARDIQANARRGKPTQLLFGVRHDLPPILFHPTFNGRIPGSPKKMECTIGHVTFPVKNDLVMKDESGAHYYRDYPGKKVFAILPDAREADHFALAAAHTDGTRLNSVLPFAVYFAELLEDSDHAFLDGVQGNFSNNKFAAESSLPKKDAVFGPDVLGHYGKARAALIEQVLRQCMLRRVPLFYRSAREYHRSRPIVDLNTAGRITYDVSRMAKALGFRTRAATAEEKRRHGFMQAMDLKVVDFSVRAHQT